MKQDTNYTQIILEFQKDTIYKPSDVTNYLTNRFPELGNELILPINTSDTNSDRIPIFIFQQNPKFIIEGNFFDITIIVYDEYRDKIELLLKEIFNCFKNKAVFYALAFTVEEQLNLNDIEKFKQHFFNNENLQKNDKIHLTFSRNIEIDNKDVLCVEGYSTINDNFISHFEFHFKRNSYKELTFEVVSNLMQNVLEYKNKNFFK